MPPASDMESTWKFGEIIIQYFFYSKLYMYVYGIKWMHVCGVSANVHCCVILTDRYKYPNPKYYAFTLPALQIMLMNKGN